MLMQKLGVVLDACMVGTGDSAFLQQAAHLTCGLYLRPFQPAALLQYLLVGLVLHCPASLLTLHHSTLASHIAVEVQDCI